MKRILFIVLSLLAMVGQAAAFAMSFPVYLSCTMENEITGRFFAFEGNVVDFVSHCASETIFERSAMSYTFTCLGGNFRGDGPAEDTQSVVNRLSGQIIVTKGTWTWAARPFARHAGTFIHKGLIAKGMCESVDLKF